METLMKFFLLVTVAIFVLGCGAFISRHRRKHYANVFQSLGFGPVEALKLRMEIARPGPFRFFRYSTIFFRGRFNDHELLFFEYWGSRRRIQPLPVVAFKPSDFKIPVFCLAAGNLLPFPLLENYSNKIDLGFVPDPHFSLRHNLRCQDKERVTALFSKEIVDFFNKNKEWSVEVNFQWMLIYSRRFFWQFNLFEMRNFLTKTVQIHQVLLKNAQGSVGSGDFK